MDVGLCSSLFILVGTFRNICAKSKFIDHRVEVTESENNYYGNFSVFVTFAPLWNYFLLFSWDEKCNYPNLHSNVDTRQIFLKYDSIWKRQNTHKKQVLSCFVNVAFNSMELDQKFIFVLNNEQEQKWGSRGSGELLLLFQYNWARSIVLHILWWKNIILYTLSFYSFHNGHPGSGIYQFPHWQVLTTSRPRLFIVDRVRVPIVGHFIPSICDLSLAFPTEILFILFQIPNTYLSF